MIKFHFEWALEKSSNGPCDHTSVKRLNRRYPPRGGFKIGRSAEGTLGETAMPILGWLCGDDLTREAAAEVHRIPPLLFLKEVSGA